MPSALSLALAIGTGTVFAESDGPAGLSGDSSASDTGPGVTAAAPVSTMSTTTAQGVYGGYVDAYPDLAAAYGASGQGVSKEAWGAAHYGAFGKSEGRSLAGPGHHDDDHHHDHDDDHHDHDDDHHDHDDHD